MSVNVFFKVMFEGFYIWFLVMASNVKKTTTYFCNDLDEINDFSKKTMIETKQLVDEIFSRQLSLGEELIACEAFKEIFLREVNKVYQNYKEEIVLDK